MGAGSCAARLIRVATITSHRHSLPMARRYHNAVRGRLNASLSISKRSAMRRMMVIAAALALAGCATAQGGYPKARTATTIARIEAAYLRVRAPAELAIARLPEPAASRARAALVIADAAFGVVRSDAAPLARAEAARELVAAVAILAGL